MAIKSQGTLLQVGTAAGSPKTITAITAASPPAVTSTSHGLANGTIIVITGVVGMTEVNNRAFVVANTATNTFELKGVDGTAYTAYVSGGTATGQTMTEVSEQTSLAGFDGQAAEIDITHNRSVAKEFLLGLQDFGQVTLALFLIVDTGHTKLRSLKAQAATGVFAITLSDGRIAAFRALVKQFSFANIQPDGAVNGQCTLRVTGEPAWFA